MQIVLNWTRRIFGSLFFIGYIPFASGTFGSAFTALLLFYYRDNVSFLFTKENVQLFYLAYIAFVMFSVFISNNAKKIFNSHDPSEIVIDEAAGQIITFFLIPLNFKTILLGFVLFRFYDIVKPFPVYKLELLDDGLGIVLDDVAAGILANISLFAIITFYHFLRTFV